LISHQEASTHRENDQDEAGLLQNYKAWKEKDRETVMFSNYSTFKIINLRTQNVQRLSLVSRYKQKFTVTNIKHSAIVMVWGCFSGKWLPWAIFFLPTKTTMNSDHYMADEKLFCFMEIHSAMYFFQDRAPCHTRKKVMAFLRGRGSA
jgi:hypothetical protein